MKQVKYFCDICGKEIINPKEEFSCVSIDIRYVHDWLTDLPISKVVKEIRTCDKCGEKVNNFIIDLINEKTVEGDKNDNCGLQ